MDVTEPRQLKGIIIEPGDADVFALHLPDDSFVVIFPVPLCGDQHKTPEEAFKCVTVKEKLKERARNERFTQRGPGGYL